MARALEVEVLPARPEGAPDFGAVAPAASLAARHGAEDQGLAVSDPGFYTPDVHALRKRMREQRTIEDFDWDLALITTRFARRRSARSDSPRSGWRGLRAATSICSAN